MASSMPSRLGHTTVAAESAVRPTDLLIHSQLSSPDTTRQIRSFAPENARYSWTSTIMSGIVSDTARHDQTEGLCYPSVTPTSVGLESWRTSRRDRCALPLATARGFSGLRQRDRAREPTTKRTGLFSRTESGSGRSNHASRGRLGAGLARSRSSANWL